MVFVGNENVQMKYKVMYFFNPFKLSEYVNKMC